MTNELMLELQYSSPLLIMAAMSVILILFDAITGENKKINYYLSIATFAAAFVAAGSLILSNNFCCMSNLSAYPLSMGMISYSGLAYLFDLIFLAAGLLVVVASREYNMRADFEHKEFYSLLSLAILAMMMISHANDLLLLFIGIELMSIMFYVLSGYFRERLESVEAALKYFLLGAFATGFLLYGIAFIYGTAGSVQLSTISEVLLKGGFNNLYITLGLGLFTIGLAFKIAAFPFHQWAPDVYTGAPTVVTAFMSTAGKAAAVFAFIIMSKNMMQSGILAVNPSYIFHIQMIIAVISAATMLVGNITAISQSNVKRMLAYSSVAHAGYMLMGIVANTPDGWAGVAFYSTAYMLMQIGAFIVVSALEGNNGEMVDFEHYAGLYRTRPVLAGVMALFMLSLAGIPPFAGFFGKYYIFKAAIASGFTWLTIIAVISSIISMYFYLKLIVFMYFKEAGLYEHKQELGSAGFSLLVAAVFIVLLGIFPNVIIDIARMFVY